MDMSGLYSSDTLEREYKRNGSRLPTYKAEMLTAFKITSSECEEEYTKCFEDITDAIRWVEYTLDLSMNWHIREKVYNDGL